jgi:hypothetical protein
VKEVPFPPAQAQPPFAKTAQDGDGVWVASKGGPGMVVTSLHPHAVQRMRKVTVVAIQLRSVELHMVVGTKEPLSKTFPKEQRTGLVPDSEQERLIAVFNGGFQVKHGKYGMKSGGLTLLPPRDESCTLVQDKQGKWMLGDWDELKAKDEQWVNYRQTPPCLVNKGELHPWLTSDWKSKRWGMDVKGKPEIRRSSLGLDKSGQILFYGVGEELRPMDLAVAMKAAGAEQVAELDINWSYTRFLWVGRPSAGKELQITDTLIPKMKHTKRGYVHHASERDFFYLLRKKIEKN